MTRCLVDLTWIRNNDFMTRFEVSIEINVVGLFNLAGMVQDAECSGLLYRMFIQGKNTKHLGPESDGNAPIDIPRFGRDNLVSHAT